MTRGLTKEDLPLLEKLASHASPEQVIDLTLAQCRANGLAWLSWVSTRDEADPGNPVKPFPSYLQYLRDLWRLVAEHQRIVIAKSRQMRVTWLLCAFLVHHARFIPNQALYYQTKAWEDAVSMVAMPEGGFEGRCQFIETHLPDWMRVPCRFSEGRIQYPNGSIIQALAGGADKIRGKVASVIVEDEFAHQLEQEGVYAAVAPLLQKGAKGIFVSTPNGADNFFALMYHGYRLGTAA